MLLTTQRREILSKKDTTIINEIDKARLKLSIEHYIKYFLGKRTCEINKEEALLAISLAVREFAMDKMYDTIARYNKVNSKRIYYLSVEYLIGRSLENNLHNLGLFNIMKSIKIEGFPDISIEEIFNTEYDPALGNGGLGRLAACYLDSMASLGIPGFGYGIDYNFGLFKQKFENGYQIEQADSWAAEFSPWQFARPDRTVKIPLYGEVETFRDPSGKENYIWMNTKTMYGVPFDFPIVGYDGVPVTERERVIDAAPDSVTLIEEMTLPSKAKRKDCYAIVRVYDGETLVSERMRTLSAEKYARLPEAPLSYTTDYDGETYSVTVGASAFARGVELTLHDFNVQWSDNFFDMVAGDSVTVTAKVSGADKAQLDKALRVRSLVDIPRKRSLIGDKLFRRKLFFEPLNFINWIGRSIEE